MNREDIKDHSEHIKRWRSENMQNYGKLDQFIFYRSVHKKSGRVTYDGNGYFDVNPGKALKKWLGLIDFQCRLSLIDHIKQRKNKVR